MERSIVIIGAGMGGLAAGIYAQSCGYKTQVFEAHTVPGGQAATWTRRGYSFDACIHHLFGCAEGSRLYELWRELGVMPRPLGRTAECVAVMAPDGRTFYDYYDLDRLAEHMRQLGPSDGRAIDGYVRALRRCARLDLSGEMILGGRWRLLRLAPTIATLAGWIRPTVSGVGKRFRDPFLQKAFRVVEYSMPDTPAFVHLWKHAAGTRGDIAWPIGGSVALARSMADRYRALGGELHLGQRVVGILTEDGKAVGVRFADGSVARSDRVISDADGRATILELLGGKFMDERIRAWCAPPVDEVNWAVHVFLGVNRDLSKEPSSLVMLLDPAVEIAGRRCENLEMQTYGMDPTMAPPGKGVIKVELFSSWSRWNALAADRPSYEAEKQRVADTVIDVLERRWPGLRGDVEAVDVPTLLTWKRFMGGAYGFNNMPAKPFDMMQSLSGRLADTLPGLERFHFVGAWATSGGALFLNALSGRRVVEKLCREDKTPFPTPASG